MEPPRSGVVHSDDGVVRCWWSDGDELYRSYHDREWGFPTADDARLFEMLALEGFQSGLSWLTILRKREGFRRAFRGFDPKAVGRFGERQVERLLADAGIVRHRGKIEATVNNARRFPALAAEFGSFAAYVWSFEPDPKTRPKRLDWPALAAMPTSPESVAMSKDLKKRGWAYVGPTTVYSFMEAVGVVNDHVSACETRAASERARAEFIRPTRP